ncbi:sulfotransferase domain-containing protein [Myxosarcina sp. GI1]|uniref:sulfotransferase domain-containing protein n=1 Tax=Myxosarcina sp. GI1 TaxID=1541065 RepID=UPI0012E08445|nr:sulfotransferase domain-containing protein [Myxosarcina sp. GI1]
MTDKRLNFVAVGPFKTATSWMYAYMRLHPQVSLPTRVKETFFFNRQDRYDKGWDWFLANFDPQDDFKLRGEFAPAYFTSEAARSRIYQINPQCKIVVSLREPISQLTSFYLHKLNRGEITQGTTLTEALKQNSDLLDNALYYTHLTKWIATYGRDNVKIVFYDLLQDSPQAFADNLCEAIGVDLLTIPEQLNQKVNVNETPVNFRLVKLVKQAGRWFYDLDLYWLIKLTKKIGLKKVIYRNKKTLYKPSTDEIDYVFNLLAADLEKLEKELNLNLDTWKKAWQQYSIENCSL